jgi:hypothetical protein
LTRFSTLTCVTLQRHQSKVNATYRIAIEGALQQNEHNACQNQHLMAPMMGWSTHYLVPSFASLLLALRTLLEHQMIYLVVEIPEHP